MTDLYDAVLAMDEGVDDPESYRRDLQKLINSGLAWTLQGRVGRAAMAAIEAGACVLGHESRRDYWGNRIPSRTEVEPGTVGSVEFAAANGFEVAE